MVLLALGAIGPGLPMAAHAVGSSQVLTPLTYSVASTSQNWAGFAVSGGTGSVSYVAGSWVQPAVKGSCPISNPRYAAFWVGIDGFSSTTVEQIGTDSDCSSGAPNYYAWYEFYPSSSVVITSVAIHAGDTVSASVSYSTTTAKFTVSLKDVTTGGSFSTSGKVTGAARSSAEWITEDPTICSPTCSVAYLTDFGTVSWGYDHTKVTGTNEATLSGATKSIGNFTGTSVTAITMYNTAGTKVMASPSALSTDKTSFTVTWKNMGP
jgi:Peptidase A4 family